MIRISKGEPFKCVYCGRNGPHSTTAAAAKQCGAPVCAHSALSDEIRAAWSLHVCNMVSSPSKSDLTKLQEKPFFFDVNNWLYALGTHSCNI